IGAAITASASFTSEAGNLSPVFNPATHPGAILQCNRAGAGSKRGTRRIDPGADCLPRRETDAALSWLQVVDAFGFGDIGQCALHVAHPTKDDRAIDVSVRKIWIETDRQIEIDECKG